MKKRLVLALSLLLAAVLMSGCALLPLFARHMVKNDNTPQEVLIEDVEDGLAYEYEMDDMMDYSKIMATSMPLMNAPMPMPEFNT